MSTSKVGLWIQSIRPKTLTASLGPVILGLSIASADTENIPFLIFFITLLCAFFLQVSSNLINDYYDHKSGVDAHRIHGPTRLTQSGQISSNQMKMAFIFTLTVSFLLGIYLMYQGGTPIIIIGLSSMLFCYLYTGGPLPLSHIALGEILALIFFGPIPVWGSYFLLTNNFDLGPALLGLGPGFIAAALMSINNLRDREDDAKSKKITVANLLSFSKARFFTLGLFSCAGVVPLFFLGEFQYIFMVYLSFFFFQSNFKEISKTEGGSALNDNLAKTGKFLFAYCVLFSLGIVLS